MSAVLQVRVRVLVLHVQVYVGALGAGAGASAGASAASQHVCYQRVRSVHGCCYVVYTHALLY